MVFFALCSKELGRISLADLSSDSPIAMSAVDAMILWSVRVEDFTRFEWPPETRIDRKGNSGVTGGDGEV